jgi:hypothetical protein
MVVGDPRSIPGSIPGRRTSSILVTRSTTNPQVSDLGCVCCLDLSAQRAPSVCPNCPNGESGWGEAPCVSSPRRGRPSGALAPEAVHERAEGTHGAATLPAVGGGPPGRTVASMLAASLRWRSLFEPIALDPHGILLDGHNRLAPCGFAEVEPRFTTYEGNDPAGLVFGGKVRRWADRSRRPHPGRRHRHGTRRLDRIPLPATRTARCPLVTRDASRE